MLYKFKIKISAHNSRPISQNGGLGIEEENFHPKPAIYNDDGKQLIILGTPICRGKISGDAVSRKLLKEGLNKSLVLEIDGSFLLILYDEKTCVLTIVNDRFASIPFYYFSHQGEFTGSINYGDIWDELLKKSHLDINRESFYEFIYLQRILGSKTYDKKSRYLNSASLLKYDAKSCIMKVDRYWRPNFTKKRRPPQEASHMLADLVSSSIRKRTGDGRRYGLLLSGGLDSRCVLAAFEGAPECVTVGERRNNEYFVAKELADARGCPHTFIKRPPGYYADILKDASFLGGGMNMYVHAHFLGMDEIRAKADVFFHGHGFDYMFGGKYLPCNAVRAFGKRTFMRKMKRLKENVGEEFLSGVSYRLKSPDPSDIVASKDKARMRESIRSSVQEIISEGRDCCNDAYDFWEYLLMHNPSRHYTSLNISSLRTAAEERTPAFDNELFDFYLSLPAERRMNKTVLVNAIRFLDERCYGIRNANTNFHIYDSDLTLTAKLAFNRALRKAGLDASLPPGRGERSWPFKADVVNGVREKAEDIPNSPALESLGFLDMDKVRVCLARHMRGAGDYSDLILTLMTIDSFISDSREREPFNGAVKGKA